MIINHGCIIQSPYFDFMFAEVAGEDAKIGLLYYIYWNFEALLKKVIRIFQLK